MPCPHNEISIVQRSQRQSAVAAAAYQSGEKLFCEYDQQVKHYPEKRGIVHNEILLPANAPQKYADRNTLWNAAEAVEKQWNSQLARRWVLTIPREIPPDQYAVLVREFCEQQFVSKGMIADFAIHDPHPPGHNPHAHIMLTMRAMDEHGKVFETLICEQQLGDAVEGELFRLIPVVIVQRHVSSRPFQRPIERISSFVHQPMQGDARPYGQPSHSLTAAGGFCAEI